jgi:hypothetical protein
VGLLSLWGGAIGLTRRRVLIIDRPRQQVGIILRGLHVWEEQWYRQSAASLATHPVTRVNPGGFNWRGWVLTLDLPGTYFVVAQDKRPERLEVFVDELARELGWPYHTAEDPIFYAFRFVTEMRYPW